MTKMEGIRDAQRAEVEAILAGTSTRQRVFSDRVSAGHYIGQPFGGFSERRYRITREHSWEIALYDGSWLLGTGSVLDAVRYLDGGNNGMPNEFRTLAGDAAHAHRVVVVASRLVGEHSAVVARPSTTTGFRVQTGPPESPGILAGMPVVRYWSSPWVAADHPPPANPPRHCHVN